ncbi:MAG: hypothetical protein ACRC28_17030 [Clostridium sp.]|uniref:hypothetical protein n=1 Tax=Clostridium sp. TaxID=1506 RepID=UPI003F2E2619
MNKYKEVDINFIDKNKDKYFSIEEALIEIGLKKSGYNLKYILKVCELENQEIIKLNEYESRYFFEKEYIKNFKKRYDEFWGEYYCGAEIKEIRNLNLKKYIEVQVPTIYASFKKKQAYKKKESDLLLEFYKKIDEKKYITQEEAIDMLGFREIGKRRKFQKDERIRKLNLAELINYSKKSCTYYNKEDIQYFVDMKKEIGKSLLNRKLIIENYKLREDEVERLLKNIKSVEGTYLFSSMNLYNRIDIENSINESLNDAGKILKRKVNKNMKTISGKTDYETFISNFEELTEVHNLKDIRRTYSEWLNFLKNYLDKDNKSKIYREDCIKDSLVVSIKLESFLNGKELFEFSSTEINFFIKTAKTQRDSKLLFDFVRYLALKKDLGDKRNRTFIGTRFVNGNARSSSKKTFSDDDIYNYEEYIKVYNHLIKIDLHIDRFFKQKDKENKKSKDIDKEYIYLSTWIYELLHLNLAWRNGDVSRFPRINFKDLLYDFGISNIEWFRKNKLTTNQYVRVIDRIYKHSFLVQKTGVETEFICSDNLKESIATSIMMMSCYWEFESILDGGVEGDLLKFNTKYNRPTASMLKLPLVGLESKGFTFGSRKMNRSVLTFMYSMSKAMNISDYISFGLSKKLREHIESMSTIQYIKFSEEQISFLSGELFRRKEFGVVVDTFIDIVSKNKPEKSIERTKEIQLVNKFFGDYSKVEALTGMLNYFGNTEKTVIDEINEMVIPKGINISENEIMQYKFEKAREYLNSIYCELMPSEKIGIQCLYSQQGCKYPFDNNENKCIGCKYSIPNIYILESCCKELKKELVEYSKTKFLGKKVKLSSNIHKKVQLLMSAIRQFGSEYVYNHLGIKREEFIELFNMIENPKELLQGEL